MIKNIIKIYILFEAICIASLVRPYDNQQLNYIHVLFEWEQEPEVSYYQIEIINTQNDSTKIIDSIFTLTHLEKEFIEFDKSYIWKMKGFIGNDNILWSDWFGPNIFSTTASKLGNITIDNEIDSLIYPGLTIFGGPSPQRHTIIIDKSGREIWNDADKEFKINYIGEYGALYGNSDYSYPNNKACKINYDLEILWSANELVDNHDMKEKLSKTFFVMRNIFSEGPIPSNNSWTQQFRNLGFVADDSTNEFPWYGQEIIEMDSNNQVLWNWNPFDHFLMTDFDNHGHTWIDAYQNMEYDWTHSNALFFDEDESAIYLSSRHLSRITKIDYPSGNVVYNISLPSEFILSGDSLIGNNLLFSFQHHIVKLDNGNYTIFDNGNISILTSEDGLRRSRALEYEVLNDSITNIIWEYILPEDLFGHAQGSMQVLENNNRLIYTRGNGANPDTPSILEITIDKEIAWRMTGTSNYAWYRAFRIPSIHPDRYSIIFNDLKITQIDSILTEAIIMNDNNPELGFKIINESNYSQSYRVNLSDYNNWFNLVEDTVYIEAGMEYEFTFVPNTFQFQQGNTLNVIVEPIEHSYRKKILLFDILTNSLNIVSKENSIIPKIVKLHQNSPNPFNSSTILKYDLPKDSFVTLMIYDILGKPIKNLIKQNDYSGFKSIQWDGTNNQGNPVSAGVYLYTIEVGKVRDIKKMIFLK